MQVLSKYKTPVAGNYHESVNGKYIDATPDILKALYSEDKLTDFEDKGTKRWTQMFWKQAAEMFLWDQMTSLQF